MVVQSLRKLVPKIGRKTKHSILKIMPGRFPLLPGYYDEGWYADDRLEIHP